MTFRALAEARESLCSVRYGGSTLSTMFDPEHVAPDAIRPLSRQEYDRMVELGMFEDERIELLRGMLVTMTPQGWQHGEVIAWLTERLILSIDQHVVLGEGDVLRPRYVPGVEIAVAELPR